MIPWTVNQLEVWRETLPHPVPNLTTKIVDDGLVPPEDGFPYKNDRVDFECNIKKQESNQPSLLLKRTEPTSRNQDSSVSQSVRRSSGTRSIKGNYLVSRRCPKRHKCRSSQQHG